MKKKRVISAVTLASCIALSATFTGCSLVSVNSRADMEQVVADIDITKSEKFEAELKPYETALAASTVSKRELISYFLNAGYSQIQNGSSYAETFNALMDALVNNAVLVQYSTMKLLEYKAADENKTPAEVVEEFNNKKDNEVEKYEWLLGKKDGVDSDDVILAKYRLYSSLNSAIDNYEKTLIEDEDEYKGTETRTTPVNLDTEQDDFYPKKEDGKTLNYGVYTGYEGYLLEDSGIYKDEDALEGTTKATRKKAYNSLINSLRRNNLVDGTKEAEKLTKVWELEYVQSEYVSQLESRIINKYYERYEKEQEEKLLAKDNDFEYIQSLYEEMYALQQDANKTASAFESAMGSMSSSSFILYSPSTDDSDAINSQFEHGRFGFVYNILLPFNAKQSAQLSELNAIKNADGNENDYYNARNQLLRQIKTEDQRSAWFNGETDYSFNVTDPEVKYTGKKYGNSDYLFFENNLTQSDEGERYKKLQAYAGMYSYNGKVLENEDGSYTLLPNPISIDKMLSEFSAYVDFVLETHENETAVEFYDGYKLNIENSGFYDKKDFVDKKVDGQDEEEIDYSKFLYAWGKVNFGDFNKANLFKEDTDQYRAMSAVNELQFAYTTDTSVLSQYVGYSVSAYDTSYIKEFEYAAKLAVANGEGSFAVCAGDYGWHLVYVTYTFDVDGGNVYGEKPDWENNIEVEGTFENAFFEWIKTTSIADVTTTQRTKIISDFNKESTVTKHQNRYQDLLDLDND